MRTVYLWQVEKVFHGNPVFGVLLGETPEETGLIGLVYSPDEKIDGHWFMRITPEENPKKFDPIHDRVIGVTSHKERVSVKLYDIASLYAAEYAEKNFWRFCDETLSGISKKYKLED